MNARGSKKPRKRKENVGGNAAEGLDAEGLDAGGKKPRKRKGKENAGDNEL